jgi:hypothetical protein
VLLGLAACAENGGSGSEARQSLLQHVERGLDSLERGKLKDLGLALPYDLNKKDFEKAYDVQVVGMEWKKNGGNRHLGGRVRLTGSSKDPRTDLWLTEVVHLDFVRVGGRGDWKLITYRGQVEDYMDRAVPGEAIQTLPQPLQDYLKSAFETLPAKELQSISG